MTQETPIATQEEKTAENTNMRRMFWATLLLAGIFTALSIYFIGFLLQQPKTTLVYLGMIIFVVMIAAAVTSVVFALRDRFLLSIKILFFAINLLGISIIVLASERAVSASFTLLIISGMLIFWVFPKRLRVLYSGYAIATIVLIWVIEAISPTWRLQLTTTTPGPGTAVIFVLLLTYIITRQTWQTNNLRSRFLVFLLGMTIVATAIIATISVFTLISAAEQAQETSGATLRDQAQEILIQQVRDIAAENNLVLQEISKDAEDTAQQAAQIFENPGAFNTEEFWKADEHMFLGGLGQYINNANDISTVFVPNTVQITEDIKKELELLAYLDIAFVPIYESDPNTVAIYYVGKEEISWLHPNINLGAILPADYQATQDIFYTSGAPENNPNHEVVWTPVYEDPGGQGLLVSTIAPVYANDTFQGVIGIDVSLAGLTAAIEEEAAGSSGGYSFVLDADGRALALPEQAYLDFYGRERAPDEFGTDFATSAKPEFGPVLSNILAGETGFQTIDVADQEFFIAYTTIEDTGWRVASVAQASEVLAPATALQNEIEALSTNLITRRLLPVGFAILAIVVIAGIFFTNLLVNPIEQLTKGAAKIGEGEWDTPLPASEIQEIDNLSNILSSMAAQIKGTLLTLEQRVRERTQNLELAAEVGQTISQVSDLDTMLTQAAELILEQFDLYYVQVYLADEQHSLLTIEAGTGAVGKELLEREHSLPISSASINGRAAMEKHPVVIPDTSQSTTFLKNPLLPETRGEMAIPLIAEEHVVGVLDMQSSQPNVLTEEVLPAFEALAGQLAVAIENAKLLEEAEQARAELEAQARRQIRTNWDEHLDAIHKPEQIGYSFDQNEVVPFNVMDEENIPDTNNAVSAPISFVGEELGALMVELDDEEKTEQTSELVNIVARQVAQQLENLRLLENAERYRQEAEEAARRQTIEGWEAYLASRSEQGLNYLYDLKEVRPYQGDENGEDVFALPLKARDEEVGKLAIKDFATEDRDSFELANAVAERLGSHIENLRLAEQTRQSLAETAEQTERLTRLNALSEAFAQSESLEDIYKVSANLLGEVIPADRFSMTQITKQGDMLEVFALQGEGGAIPTGTQLPIEGTAVGAAFSERHGIIVPDLTEKTYMENELLAKQGLKSTLSVPLIVAGQAVGTLNFGSTKPNNYTSRDQDLAIQAASLMASSIESRQQYERSQRQAEREAMLNAINQKIQNATSVEAVLQIAARELGHALGAPMTVAQLSIKDQE